MRTLRKPAAYETKITAAEANAECTTCAYCGATNISPFTHSEWIDGLGTSTRKLRTDIYMCSCGHMWESEPYETT